MTIWGQKIELRQTFQRIDSLKLENASNTIKFNLSNDAYLLIVNEGAIMNSGFSLTFKDTPYIEISINGIKHGFELEAGNNVKTPKSSVDTSSIYLNAVVIQK